jgi:septal ring factor EnvC (AmiA/AmiB activator)
MSEKNQIEILEIKSPFRQIKNTVEGHSRRPEQVEDGISELEDKIDIKVKTELLVKQLKSCERNIQELKKPIRRSNLRIMGIEEGGEEQAKWLHNIFKIIITENIPTLEQELPIQV